MNAHRQYEMYCIPLGLARTRNYPRQYKQKIRGNHINDFNIQWLLKEMREKWSRKASAGFKNTGEKGQAGDKCHCSQLPVKGPDLEATGKSSPHQSPWAFLERFSLCGFQNSHNSHWWNINVTLLARDNKYLRYKYAVMSYDSTQR